MTRKSITLTDQLHDYLLAVSLREPDILRQLREETLAMPMARMQIAPEQGQFMYLLARLMAAQRAIEVGTFTGYSALWLALALPASGRLVTCDINPDYTNIAHRYWQEAHVDDRIDLRLGPAIETLDQLLNAGQGDSYDLAFIDADKPEYPDYYERCLALVRSGGLIIVDNVLWGGKPADESVQDEDTQAIRSFNLKLKQDDRVDISLLPVADGITLAMKR